MCSWRVPLPWCPFELLGNTLGWYRSYLRLAGDSGGSVGIPGRFLRGSWRIKGDPLRFLEFPGEPLGPQAGDPWGAPGRPWCVLRRIWASLRVAVSATNRFVIYTNRAIHVYVISTRLQARLRSYEPRGLGPPSRYCKQSLKQIAVYWLLVAENDCC